MKSGQGKKNQSPRFFSPAFSLPSFFFSFSPSFFLAPVSPPINAANKNNERPPARTLHPLVPVLIRSSSGGRWFAVRKGRRLLLQTASRQREDTGLCILSPSFSHPPLCPDCFSFFPSKKKKKRNQRFDLDPRNRGFLNVLTIRQMHSSLLETSL